MRILDSLPDGNFLVRLQQPALADVLQVDAHQVDVIARHALFWLLDLLLFRLLIGCQWLICECFRLLVTEHVRGRDAERSLLFSVLMLVDVESESVGTLSPVEDMSWTGGVVPFNQRRAAACRPEREGGVRRGGCFLVHGIHNRDTVHHRNPFNAARRTVEAHNASKTNFPAAGLPTRHSRGKPGLVTARSPPVTS